MLRPRRFLGLGGSYKSYIAEIMQFMALPKHQIWFNKQVTCLNGGLCDDIFLPKNSHTLSTTKAS